MRHPIMIVCAPDDWLANQLRELVADRRWLLKLIRRPAAMPDLVPCVLLVQIDVHEATPEMLALLASARTANPDAAAIAVIDTKVADEDKAAWTASLFDLGCRLVLFPPLTRPVIEDAVSGLMEAVIQRGMPDKAAT